MSKRAVGFLTSLLWLLAIYFFAVSLMLSLKAYAEAEQALVTGLCVLAGGFALAAFTFSCVYLKLNEEARLRELTARANDARNAAAAD